MIEQVGLPIGASAPDFSLKGVDGKTYNLAAFKDKRVLVVMIWCNHCPYVQAYEERIIKLQAEYAGRGVHMVAINPNDDAKYPDDSFEEMVKRARDKKYNFTYLRDASQDIAKAYNAICTPQIFVFDEARKLRYHGRVDDNRDPSQATTHDLRNALDAVLSGTPVAVTQTRPFGCSVKWRHA